MSDMNWVYEEQIIVLRMGQKRCIVIEYVFWVIIFVFGMWCMIMIDMVIWNFDVVYWF